MHISIFHNGSMMASVIIKFIDGFKSGLVEIREIEQHQRLLIGKDPSCDIQLDDNDETVIDFHCSIVYDGSAFHFQKIDGLTKINGNRFSHSIRLKAGDQISVGKNQTLFSFDSIPQIFDSTEPEQIKIKRGLFRRVLKRG